MTTDIFDGVLFARKKSEHTDWVPHTRNGESWRKRRVPGPGGKLKWHYEPVPDDVERTDPAGSNPEQLLQRANRSDPIDLLMIADAFTDRGLPQDQQKAVALQEIAHTLPILASYWERTKYWPVVGPKEVTGTEIDKGLPLLPDVEKRLQRVINLWPALAGKMEIIDHRAYLKPNRDGFRWTLSDTHFAMEIGKVARKIDTSIQDDGSPDPEISSEQIGSVMALLNLMPSTDIAYTYQHLLFRRASSSGNNPGADMRKRISQLISHFEREASQFKSAKSIGDMQEKQRQWNDQLRQVRNQTEQELNQILAKKRTKDELNDLLRGLMGGRISSRTTLPSRDQLLMRIRSASVGRLDSYAIASI